MNKFRKWLAKKISPDQQNMAGNVSREVSTCDPATLTMFGEGSALTLALVGTDTGIVIESRQYDDKTSDWRKKLYIVRNDDGYEELSTTIQNIVLLNSMCR